MTRHFAPAALICGGSVVVIVADQLGDMRLLGAGFLVALAGLGLGVALRSGPAPEKLRGLADDFDRRLPSGGTGRAPTPRSATIGIAYATITALCWAALFMLGGDVRGSTAEITLALAGTLLLFGGQLERLSRIWGWRWTAAWAAALPLSLLSIVVGRAVRRRGARRARRPAARLAGGAAAPLRHRRHGPHHGRLRRARLLGGVGAPRLPGARRPRRTRWPLRRRGGRDGDPATPREGRRRRGRGP